MKDIQDMYEEMDNVVDNFRDYIRTGLFYDELPDGWECTEEPDECYRTTWYITNKEYGMTVEVSIKEFA